MDGNRPFTNSRGYPLHVAGADIPNGKNASQAGFQHLRRSGCVPNGRLGRRIQVAPGQDESFVIEGYAALQPICSGRCSRHDEYMANVADGSLAGFVPPTDAFQMRITFKIHDLCSVVQLYSGILFDALDQVARHGVRKLTGPHQHVDLACSLREKNCRLSGRISPTHHNDVFLFAQL